MLPFRSFVCLTAATLLPSCVVAQSLDVVRGRVHDDQGSPILGVRVTVTTVSGSLARRTSTDGSGRFAVTFPGGDGDYLVSLSLIGYGGKRFEVKRVGDQDVLIADATLSRVDPNTLPTVQVNGRQRAIVARGDTTADIGGNDIPIDDGLVLSAQLGELAAMAASLPGVLYVPGADGDPGGFSVLGLDHAQNSITLNGLSFGGSDLPRDAAFSSSLMLAPYDVTNGGFSGAQLAVRLRSGTNVLTRTSSVLMESPTLQWSDASGRGVSLPYANISVGGALAGAIRPERAFYNVAYQLGRRTSDARSLLDRDTESLTIGGIAADSVARLRAILSDLQVPVASRTTPRQRTTDQGSFAATFDLAPSSTRSGQAAMLTLLGSASRVAPATLSGLEVPLHSGERERWSLGVQAHYSTFVAFGILSETAVSASAARSDARPYLTLPDAAVRITSDLADGSRAIRSVAFGGHPALSNGSSQRQMELRNQLSWFSADNRHRLRLTADLRSDVVTSTQVNAPLGSFVFNSLQDVAERRPAQFTRDLSARETSSHVLVGSVALSDAWRLQPTLQLMFGVRLDASLFPEVPRANGAVRSVLDVRTDRAPTQLDASPRIGFSWSYGRAKVVGAFPGAAPVSAGVIRGGIGVFQDAPSAGLLSPALGNTGLADATRQVVCVGAAVPVVDWASWSHDEASIPRACADGGPGTPTGSSLPLVTTFVPGFAQPRSVRSSVQWQGSMFDNRLSLLAELLYSRGQRQSDIVDLNIASEERFRLRDEGARPVFVGASSIDARSGAASTADSRRTSAFGRVLEHRSDLSSEARQFRLQLQPAAPPSGWGWSVGYVYQTLREQTRGFASSAGNPWNVEWSRGASDTRHQVVLNVRYTLLDAVRFSWTANIRSGMPYTPMIVGDVNGDGFNNDRAFVFDPARASAGVDSVALRALFASASPSVNRCLRTQIGAVAGRNSCEGPWTVNSLLDISLNALRFGLPQRAAVSFQLANPVAALDLMLHGSQHPRGWGQPATPDATLLFVRGFDAARQQYAYDVNPRFGSTALRTNTARIPASLSVMVRVDWAPAREVQQLQRTLERGRRQSGARASEAELRLAYANGGGLLNPLTALLRQGDSLSLSAAQADSLARMNRRYTQQLDSIWRVSVRVFAALPDDFDDRAARREYLRSREGTVDLLLRIAPAVTALLSDEQRQRLPPLLLSFLDPRYLRAIRSGTVGLGGRPFGPDGTLPPTIGAGALIGR